MRIFTSRWANREVGELACTPTGVSRGTPRFAVPYRFKVVRELAPDDLTWRQQDPEAFKASYLRQLEEIGAGRVLARLEEVSGGLAVVLLCFEDLAQPGAWCHRTALGGFLEREAGVVVPELAAGMLPRRPDSPQVSLFENYGEENA